MKFHFVACPVKGCKHALNLICLASFFRAHNDLFSSLKTGSGNQVLKIIPLVSAFHTFTFKAKFYKISIW